MMWIEKKFLGQAAYLGNGRKPCRVLNTELIGGRLAIFNLLMSSLLLISNSSFHRYRIAILKN